MIAIIESSHLTKTKKRSAFNPISGTEADVEQRNTPPIVKKLFAQRAIKEWIQPCVVPIQDIKSYRHFHIFRGDVRFGVGDVRFGYGDFRRTAS